MLDKIQQNLKAAQFAKDELQVSVLRMLMSELKYAEINKASDLTDEEILSIIQKELKKRRDSIAAFTQAGRTELADKEKAEAVILETYLPAQMSDEELTDIVRQTITDLGASSMADMGKVIGQVMTKTQGLADGSRISGLVKQELTK